MIYSAILATFLGFTVSVVLAATAALIAIAYHLQTSPVALFPNL